jgi:oligopeptidase B
MTLAAPTPATPPVAERVPVTLERHGLRWVDPYAWLRDPGYPKVEDPAIRAYLEAENAYFEAVMAPHAGLIEALHAELKGRIKDDDSSVPVPDGAWLYHWAFTAGAQYRTWYRAPRSGGAPEVILDEPSLALGQSYFNLGSLEVSPNAALLAYGTDSDGSERYVIRIKDLASGELVGEAIPGTSGGTVWAADSSAFFYVELNDKLRPYRVRLHRLGQPPESDPIVYEEDDPAFFVGLGQTQSRRFVIVSSGSHVTREIRLIEAAAPEQPPLLVAARRDEHRYSVEHAGDRLWIRTNDVHENFRLVWAPVDSPGEAHWREELPGDDDDYLIDVTCFADFMVVTERRHGLANLRVRRYDGSEHAIDFHEAVFTAGLGDNREFACDRLRLGFASLTTPATVFDYDVAKRELETLKVQEIPSGYDPGLYVGERIWATAADGTEVPISILHRKDYPLDGTGRLFLYGYGSYGMGMQPAFNAARLSLVDRGFAFAIAHVRGGDEMGHRWYRQGKLAAKMNSFTDFVACAEALVDAGYAKAGEIAIRGGSAGGMLMGAVANMRPELWRCVVAEVPFVDVLNTMLDETLPLTPIEWPEWGNPLTSKEDFLRIRDYCPYENVVAKDYPAMLVTAGISDPRVTYWEPAKYVAKLRARKTDSNLLLLKTNMDAGHFGASGRFDALREHAEVLAFVFKCFGIGDIEADR